MVTYGTPKPDKATERRNRILAAIHYESQDGAHTYHPCNCGRMSCRREKCVLCWTDELEDGCRIERGCR